MWMTGNKPMVGDIYNVLQHNHRMICPLQGSGLYSEGQLFTKVYDNHSTVLREEILVHVWLFCL
jgi:hypothetical protein